MLPIAFKQATQKQSPAVFNYACEVRRIWCDFPPTKQSVSFFEHSIRKLVCPDEEYRRKTQRRIANENILSLLEPLQERRISCVLHYREHSYIILSTEENEGDFLPEPAQDRMFSFDHELGHVIIPGASGAEKTDLQKCNLQECIADAYATIRHLQRYGANSPTIDILVLKRIYNFILYNDREHFTSPVIEKILEERHKIDWDRLTPHETTDLARQFALVYAMPEIDQKLMWDSFEKARTETTLEDVLETAAMEMLKPLQYPNVFKYGALFLEACFAGKFNKELSGADFDVNSKYWKNVRQKLAKNKKALEANECYRRHVGLPLLPLMKK